MMPEMQHGQTREQLIDHIDELESALKQQKHAAEDHMWAARGVPRLKAQIKTLKQDVAFYKCCALSGEIPKDGSEPSALQ